MQKMFIFLSLLMAKTIPHDIAACRAGCTATVVRLRPLSIMIAVGTPKLYCRGIVAIIPMTARMAMMPTNLKPSE